MKSEMYNNMTNWWYAMIRVQDMWREEPVYVVDNLAIVISLMLWGPIDELL